MDYVLLVSPIVKVFEQLKNTVIKCHDCGCINEDIIDQLLRLKVGYEVFLIFLGHLEQRSSPDDITMGKLLSYEGVFQEDMNRLTTWEKLCDKAKHPDRVKKMKEVLDQCEATVTEFRESFRDAITATLAERNAHVSLLQAKASQLEDEEPQQDLYFQPCIETVQMKQTDNYKLVLQHSTNFGQQRVIAFSSEGKQVASVSLQHAIQIWDTLSGEAVTQALLGHTSAVRCVAISPDGSSIVSGSNDRTVRVWDLQSGEAITKALQGHNAAVRCVAISADNNLIGSGSDDRTVRLWHTHNGEEITEALTGHTGAVRCIAISGDGNLIVSGSDDETVRVWDLRSLEAVTVASFRHDGAVRCVAMSSDGNLIVSGSDDETVGVWNLHGGEAVTEALVGHNNAVRCVVISTDGNLIVSGSDDKTVRVWDLRNGGAVTVAVFRHSSAVRCITLSADGKRIVSGSRENTIHMFDIHSREAVGMLVAHNRREESVVLGPPLSRNLPSRQQAATLELTAGQNSPRDLENNGHKRLRVMKNAGETEKPMLQKKAELENFIKSRSRIEQEFASQHLSPDEASMDILAGLLKGVRLASQGDPHLDMYYKCRVLAFQFTNPEALASLTRLLNVGASGFPKQPILANRTSMLLKMSLSSSSKTLDAVQGMKRRVMNRSLASDSVEVTDAKRAEIHEKLKRLLHAPLTKSKNFDLSRSMFQLRDIQSVESSVFEDWFEDILQGLQAAVRNEEAEESPNSTIMDIKGNPAIHMGDSLWTGTSLHTEQRYAAAMVYWAIDGYGDASHPMSSEFRILLLFSAAATLERYDQLLKRNYVLSLLSDILSENIELLHEHLYLLESKLLVNEVSRRTVPSEWMKSYSECDANGIRNYYPEQLFLLFMQLIAMENDLLLDEEDLVLLSTLKGAVDFPFWDNVEQLRTHGVCVQLRPDSEMPRESSTCMLIEYGRNSLTVMIEPALLTALGFSILSFILIPNELTVRGFKRLIALVRTFTNCFVREFEREGNRLLTKETEDERHSRHEPTDAEQPKPKSKVFIPLEWAYTLNVSVAFLREHGEIGSHGVLLGNLRNKFASFGKHHNRSVLSMQLKKRQDYVPNKRLWLDGTTGEYRLVYLEPSKRMLSLKGVNMKAKAVFVELGADVERENNGAKQPKKVWFVSLQQFITFNFHHHPRAGIVTRFKWLEDALQMINLFPRGENQRLLRNVLSEDVCTNAPCGIFSDTDCRLRFMSLQKQNLPFKVLQFTRTDTGNKIGNVFFIDVCPELGCTGNVYKCPFEVSNDGICVNGRCKSATEQDEAELAQAEALTMDLL